MKNDLISKALARRFGELCRDRISHLAPARFAGMTEYVSAIKERLVKASPDDLRNTLSKYTAPQDWIASDSDCLSSLRLFSLGESLPVRPGQDTAVKPFLEELDTARHQPDRRFRLLTQRYACPQNFALPREEEVREYILMRLMVHDRARMEASFANDVSSDDLLLKLNLVAVHAAWSSDLRFLDALNYYYELLPANWHPETQNGWLLVSYFALYARVLAARI